MMKNGIMKREKLLEKRGKSHEKKIVLFGDSITAGYLDEAVSPVLVDLVKRDIVAMGLEEVAVINAGMPGDTTEDGLKTIK